MNDICPVCEKRLGVIAVQFNKERIFLCVKCHALCPAESAGQTGHTPTNQEPKAMRKEFKPWIPTRTRRMY